MEDKKISEQDLILFAKWFNQTQFRGGKGDAVKALFCKCDYEGIVKQGLKELKEKLT